MTQSRLDSSTVRSNPGRISDASFVDDDDATAEERREAAERDASEAGLTYTARNDQPRDEPREKDTQLGTSYLGDGKSDESWQRWRQIQADFVDDPRNSVSEAHGLVGELIDGIVRRFEDERQQLEERWSSGEDVSTEDLRHCLQRYRDFFGRLLSNLESH